MLLSRELLKFYLSIRITLFFRLLLSRRHNVTMLNVSRVIPQRDAG